MKERKIGVIGLWHLGCVLCAAWSKLGHTVIGFDYSKKLIKDLKKNEPPVFELGLKELLADGLKKGVLSFTANPGDIKDCDFIFLAYDTPVLDNDDSDLAILKKAVDDIARYIKGDSVVIVSSQVPVSTCGEFRKRLQKRNPAVELVYSPENLRLGEAISCYLNPGRIIIGADSDCALSEAKALFSEIPGEILTMNLASAEMVKHAINAFLANSIVFTNQLADLCEVCGANVFDVVRGMKSEPRIGVKAYLSAGIGFSGGTLGRDLRVLAKLNSAARQRALLYKKLLDYNTERKKIIISKIARLLKGNFSQKTIAVLGLTYKPGTSTLRRSLPLEIIKILARRGAKIKAYDPKANYQELRGKRPFQACSSIEGALSGSNLILLLTEWEEFKHFDWAKGADLLKDKVFFDAKNFLVQENLAQKGYLYFGVGFRNK